MADEEQPINLQIIVNRYDNRSVGMQVQTAERVEFHSEQSSVTEEATSSTIGVQINQGTLQGARGMTSSAIDQPKKLKLRQVFTLQDGNTATKCDGLMSDCKFDDAFEVMNKQHSLGSIGGYSQQLVQFHECLIRTKRPEQANKIRLELISLIRENIETDPQEIKDFADALRGKSKCFDSVLFYYLSAILYKDATEPNLAVEQIALCVDGMQHAIDAMLHAEKGLKSVVKHHVIPLISNMTMMIINTTNATTKSKCLSSNWCNLRKERCEGIVEDYEAREHTLKDAIESMRSGFGEKAKEYQLFGHLLNNLGYTYSQISQLKEAERYYELAIQARREATDYSNPNERIMHIEQSEHNLQSVKMKQM